MAGFELSFATHATTSLMFGVGIGHNAKRRIEPQLFFQRLTEIITLAAQLVILRFQCRQLRQLLLLHLDALIKRAAQLATLPLQACQLLGKLARSSSRGLSNSSIRRTLAAFHGSHHALAHAPSQAP
jgi:hypothetical protein